MGTMRRACRAAGGGVLVLGLVLGASRGARGLSVDDMLKGVGAPAPAAPAAAPAASGAPAASAAPAPAAPGAQEFYGWGSETKGGSGGPTKSVSASGLKGALGEGNATVLVTDGGTISGDVKLPSNITIRGTPAFTVKGMIDMDMEVHDIVLQNFRVRDGHDGLHAFRGCHDLVFDHMSADLAHDGGIDITEGIHDVVISYCIIAKTGGEGKGSLWKYLSYHLSAHHNLWYSNFQRSPQISYDKIEYYKGKVNFQAPIVDLRNNAMLDWGYYATWMRTGECGNVINNLYANKGGGKGGKNGNNCVWVGNTFGGKKGAKDASACVQGNVNLTGEDPNTQSNHGEYSAPPIGPNGMKPPIEAAKEIAASAGPRPLDALDQEAITALQGYIAGK